MGAEDGEKSAKFWASHPSGPHPSGLHPSNLTFSRFAPHPEKPPPFGAHYLGPITSGSHFFLAPHLLGPHHDTHQIQKQVGQNWIGKTTMTKN